MDTPFTDGLLSIAKGLAGSNPMVDVVSVASGLETGLRVGLSNSLMVKSYLEGLNHECGYDKKLEEMDTSVAEVMVMILEARSAAVNRG